MSDFFEPVPELPRERHFFRHPPWVGPPHGTLPGSVALELVLARTDAVAIAISRIDAYSTGFGFDVVTIAAPGDEQPEFLESMMFGPAHVRARREQPEQLLRVGLQLADGTKLIDTDHFQHDGDQPPSGPVLHSAGGGGGGGRWRHGMWVWPLPPAGPIQFVVEWPAAGIPLSRHEVDVELILEASRRAQVLFEDEDSTLIGA